MDLLDIDVPVNCRGPVWTTEAARERWEPSIQRINSIWGHIERLSVVRNEREACQQVLTPEGYDKVSAWCRDFKLTIQTLRTVKSWNGFAHYYQDTTDDDPNRSIVVLIYRSADREYPIHPETWNHLDDTRKGLRLGYPSCCSDWFPRAFPKFIDPVWQIAMRSQSGYESGILRVAQSILSPCLRYIGLRLIHHLPCSLECAASYRVAVATELNLAGFGGPELAGDLRSLLNMNLEWSVLHGIAVVRTPLFHVVSSSVPTARKYVIQFRDLNPKLALPEGSAVASGFPYSD